ncbi:MAG: DNA internalization-related competence protein ComEC/Rec2 [Pseudomonadota bacterium]
MFRWAIFAFAMGCAWLQTRAQLPDMRWAWSLPLLVVLLVFFSGEKLRLARLAGVVALALMAGVFYATWRAEVRLGQTLDPHWEGRDLRVQGLVIGLPEATTTGLGFVLSVAAVSPAAAEVPERLRLSWWLPAGAPPPVLAGGDCVELGVRLYRPHGNLNPAGFDYEAWLLERGIRATGTVRDAPVLAQGCGGALRAQVDRTRAWVRAHLLSALAGREYAGVVSALAVGDQDAIPTSQWTLFRQTGTSHLFSVSGLHITLFSSLVYLFARLVWRRLPRLNLFLPAHRGGIALGLLAAGAYTLLAGFGIPAQRTLYMLAGGALLAWTDQRASPSRILALALLVVVLVDPWAALAPGFWLSFGAVAVLMLAATGQRETGAVPWRTWLRAQWAVTLGLLPLLLALFHEISLVSPLANALAIPVISLLAVPLGLLAALVPWDGLALVAHAVVWAVMQWLQALAALPQPVFHGAAPGPLALGLAILGTLVLLLPRGVPGRWLGLVLCLPLFFPRLPAPAAGEVWITALDVGQGSAVLVRTARRTLLVDAGPRFASGEDAGARIIAPHLWALGINRLDGLIITHDDIDHSGGAAALLASHRPTWFLNSLAGVGSERLSETGRALLVARPDARACQAGQTWTWDGVSFSMLHPPAHHYALAGYSDNERSCVLRVDSPHGSLLLAGDMERLTEMNLAERHMLLAADVLLVPHHGSKGASGASFLAAVQPRLALIQVGHRNRFGHPHPEVLARYRMIGAQVYRTDRDGAVSLVLGQNGPVVPVVDQARESHRRYWHSVR